jgi:MerR family transcriptional regulator, light-induced transcriptional regulator
MADYSIRDLERLSGIKAHTIRIWEKRYGLIEPRRTMTNIRTYCDTELKKILNVSMLNRNGIKISKIARMSPREIADQIDRITYFVPDELSQIEALTASMIDFDENRFEKIIARSVMQLGFEDTIIKIIYPFFVKIGLTWQTGFVNPAQEHFITNLVRQKVMVAIDNLFSPDKANAKHFLFFLPEGEWHELGILFFAYLAKKRGYAVIYLGQSVPMSDLADLLRVKPFDGLVTAFVCSGNKSEVLNNLKMLSEVSGSIPVFISGVQVEHFEKSLPAHFMPITSPMHFIEMLEKGETVRQ